MAQERRSSRTPADRSGDGQSSRRSNDRRRRSRSFAASSGMLYAVAVIGVSILLACVCWIAANDVLALNKPEKEVTITVDKEDSFNRLKKEGLIEYKGLFKLFASVTGGKAKVSPGTYTLNTDMDYRALLSGMSVNSSTKAEITITIPEGWEVEELPKSVNIATQGREITARIVCGVDNNVIKCNTIFKINKVFFANNRYDEVKTFFANIVERSKDLIVLKKKP